MLLSLLALNISVIFLLTECSWPLGVSNYKIADAQISASTSFNDMHLPFHARLGQVISGSLGGWCPYKDSDKEFLEIDFSAIKKVTGNNNNNNNNNNLYSA